MQIWYPESINPYSNHIFSDKSLSRETVTKENVLVSQVLFTIRFRAILTKKKGVVVYRKYLKAKEVFKGMGNLNPKAPKIDQYSLAFERSYLFAHIPKRNDCVWKQDFLSLTPFSVI